jgi:hypothetical protein
MTENAFCQNSRHCSVTGAFLLKIAGSLVGYPETKSQPSGTAAELTGYLPRLLEQG